MLGLPEMHVEDVSCDNLTVYLDRENKKTGSPDSAPGFPKVAGAGFIAQRVDRLSLRNVQIIDQRGPAITINDARDLVLSNVEVPTAPADGPSIELTDVQGADIHDCIAPTTIGQPLRVTGGSNIHVRDNNFEPTTRPTNLTAH